MSSWSSDFSGFSVTGVAAELSALWAAGLSLLPAAEVKQHGSIFNYLVYSFHWKISLLQLVNMLKKPNHVHHTLGEIQKDSRRQMNCSYELQDREKNSRNRYNKEATYWKIESQDGILDDCLGHLENQVLRATHAPLNWNAEQRQFISNCWHGPKNNR